MRMPTGQSHQGYGTISSPCVFRRKSQVYHSAWSNSVILLARTGLQHVGIEDGKWRFCVIGFVQTLYSIGSCSNPFGATSVGLLIDDFVSGHNRTALPPSVDKLTWYTKIISLFPTTEWTLQDAYATEKASLRDLLSHMSGILRHELAVHPDENTIDVLNHMRFLKSTELREKWQYSNQMYSVVAYIISKYSGLPFRQFVHERIFGPLNMTDSTYDPVRAEQSGKLSHAWAPNGRRIPFWRYEVTGDVADGSGGINSNAVDMTK